MDFASLWEQLQVMLQSDAPMFTIGSFVITERIAGIAGIISGVLTIIAIIQIFISVIRWIFTPKAPQPEMIPVRMPITEGATKEETELAQMAKAKQIAEDPNSIVDTSDKKRSLYDYVTPDSIHAEVLKQTLNNDYPYQVLRPGTMLPNLPQNFGPLSQGQKEGSLSSVEFQLPQLPGTENVAMQTAPVIQPTATAETVTAPSAPVPPIQIPVISSVTSVAKTPSETNLVSEISAIPAAQVNPAVAIPEVPVATPPAIAEVPKITETLPSVVAPITPATVSPAAPQVPEIAPTIIIPPVQTTKAPEVTQPLVPPVINQPETSGKTEQLTVQPMSAPLTAKSPNSSVYSPTDPLLP